MNLAATTLATFDQLLGTLDHLLGKAAASDQGEALLQARLAPDMFPLATQVRFTTQQVYNTLNRLFGTDHAGPASDHATLAEVRALIAAAHAAAPVSGDTMIEFDVPNGLVFRLSAADYVRDWSMPQFHFHLMTAYAILRANGLAIGKADYLGYMMRHLKAPPSA